MALLTDCTVTVRLVILIEKLFGFVIVRFSGCGGEAMFSGYSGVAAFPLIVKPTVLSTFHLYVVAALTLPAWSVARTANWCCWLLFVSTITVNVNGEVHAW